MQIYLKNSIKQKKTIDFYKQLFYNDVYIIENNILRNGDDNNERNRQK